MIGAKREQKKSETLTPEKREKQKQALSQANQEIKKETGIDFVKMFLGDPKEKRRFEMKRFQERLKNNDDSFFPIKKPPPVREGRFFNGEK